MTDETTEAATPAAAPVAPPVAPPAPPVSPPATPPAHAHHTLADEVKDAEAWCGEHARIFERWLREHIAGGPIARDVNAHNHLHDALPALARLLSQPAK